MITPLPPRDGFDEITWTPWPVIRCAFHFGFPGFGETFFIVASTLPVSPG